LVTKVRFAEALLRIEKLDDGVLPVLLIDGTVYLQTVV